MSFSAEKIPATIITGFLGAGKNDDGSPPAEQRER